MAGEFFNIFVDTDDENIVTARVFQKHYQGFRCKVEDWAHPEEALEKIRAAMHRAIDEDFNERYPKIIKYITRRELEQKEFDFDDRKPTKQELLNELDADSDECIACQ